MPVFALGTAVGALLGYLFDRQNGARRRHDLVGRSRHIVRRGLRGGRGVKARMYGYSQKLRHLREQPKEFDDATLADKVRTEIFRPPDVPKGQINVNAQNGIVQLRGEVERPELIETLVDQTRKVHGVREVENLLHVPGTEAPMHE